MRVKVGLRRVENTVYPPNQLLVALLEYFMHHVGRLIPQQELYENVWGQDGDTNLFSQTHKVPISSLRRKLASPSQNQPALITTIPQVGYRFGSLTT